MGKKSRLKRRKYNLLRHEFVSYVCPQCGLCQGSTGADFCYEGQYVENPKKFIKETLKSLKDIREALPLMYPNHQPPLTLEDDEEFEYTLEEAFCAKNLCGNGINAGTECAYKIGCLHAFRSQIRNEGNNLMTFRPNHGHKVRKQKKNKKGKQHKKPYIPPTPKFFCNEAFRPEVDKIINGDHTEQQDKGKEPTRSTAEHASGEAADTKP